MPVRSPRGRSAAYRALWQWPLRSPARLGLCAVLVVAAVVGAVTGIGALRGPRPEGSVAARWAAAWVDHPQGTTPQQWVDGLRPFTTDEYLGVLNGVDPANVPASRVVGEPRAVRVAERSVQVEVPTNTLTLRVLVVATEDGWRVAGYEKG